MLVVDPWHWLHADGSIPTENPRLRTNLLAVLRVIEYGSPLSRGATRETLSECKKRPDGRRCMGLLRVRKTEDDRLLAFCPKCDTEQMLVSNWQKTRWAREPGPATVRKKP